MPLSYEESLPLVGQHFAVHTQQGPVELRLVEAQERPRRGLPEAFRTPLSLIFTAPSTIVLSQDVYPVEHPHIGTRQWMFVPILPPAPAGGDGGAGQACGYYQVLFA